MSETTDFLKSMPVWSEADKAVAGFLAGRCRAGDDVGYLLGLLLQHAWGEGSVCLRRGAFESFFSAIFREEMSARKKTDFFRKLRDEGRIRGVPANPRPEDLPFYGEFVRPALRKLDDRAFCADPGNLGKDFVTSADDSAGAEAAAEAAAALTTPVVYSMDRLYISRYYAYETGIAAMIRARFAAGAGNREPGRPGLSERFTPENIRRAWREVYGGPEADPAAETEIDWQKVAVATALYRDLAIITGGPGTGKTYSVARLIRLLKKIDPDLRILIAAPTGKAAARVTESLAGSLRAAADAGVSDGEPAGGIERAKTVHSLIGTYPDSSRTRHGEREPLECDALIVDEVSMMDIALMHKTLKAVRPGGKIILLGDKDQLSSVEAGSILGDICAVLREGGRTGPDGGELRFISELTGYAPERLALSEGLAPGIVALRKSRRYESSPLIGILAERLNGGENFSGTEEAFTGRAGAAPGPAADFAAKTIRFATGSGEGGTNGAVILAGIGEERVKRLCREIATGWGQSGVDPGAGCLRDYFAFMSAHRTLDGAAAREAFGRLGRFRALCPEREGRFGTKEVNELIAKEGLGIVLGGPREAAEEETGWDSDWFPGLALLITKNDRQLNLNNGDVVICGYDAKHGNRRRVWACDENGEYRSVSFGLIPEHIKGFAMTIHKSQGSEFDHVMIVMSGEERMITRELIYTGVTRAKHYVSMAIGNGGSGDLGRLDGAFRKKVERASGLAERLYGEPAEDPASR